MLRVFAAMLALLFAVPAAAKADAGTLVDLGIVQSKYADARRVQVWLPSTYTPRER